MVDKRYPVSALLVLLLEQRRQIKSTAPKIISKGGGKCYRNRHRSPRSPKQIPLSSLNR